jgi:hypothetical protein
MAECLARHFNHFLMADTGQELNGTPDVRWVGISAHDF